MDLQHSFTCNCVVIFYVNELTGHNVVSPMDLQHCGPGLTTLWQTGAVGLTGGMQHLSNNKLLGHTTLWNVRIQLNRQNYT